MDPRCLRWCVVVYACVGFGGCDSRSITVQGVPAGVDAATLADVIADADVDAVVVDVPATAAPDSVTWPAQDAPPPIADACASSDATRVLPRACAAQTPPWLVGKAIPAATLKVDVGIYDAKQGKFTPWVDGQWAPMHDYMRGGFGVWAAIAVTLPANTPDPAKLRVVAEGLIGCKKVAATVQHVMYFDEIAGQPGVYVNADDWSGGACIRFDVNPKNRPLYCGQWLTIRAQVGTTDGAAWGETTRVVRLYGEAAKP